MFRRFAVAIFRLYLKYLVSSYTRLLQAVYSGEVGGEMGTRSGMCYGGWEVRVLGDYIVICYVYVNIVRSVVSYCVL